MRLPAGNVLRDVSLSHRRRARRSGLVGESGSGKSMTAKAIARLLPPGAVASGSRRRSAVARVFDLPAAELRRHRAEVAMIFQDPRAHINPVRRIGDFMTEALRASRACLAARRRGGPCDMLDQVGIDDAARRLRQYPHELSGGMLQRVMIAAALLTEPRLLLADEPTTALDVTTQAEVMAILDELRRDRGLSLLFITHDLELAAAVCDRTAVMYAGQIVETRSSDRLHDDPLHPYTAALARGPAGHRPDRDPAAAIPGRPLSAFEAPRPGARSRPGARTPRTLPVLGGAADGARRRADPVRAGGRTARRGWRWPMPDGGSTVRV